MIKVCPGWTPLHKEPIVMEPEDGDQPGKISHGMCAGCKADMDAMLDREEAKRELPDHQR